MRIKILDGYAFVLALTGCAAPLEDPERFEGCTTQQAEQLMVAKCGSCHGTTAPGGSLDLVTPSPGTRMLGVPSPQGPCMGQPLISRDGDHLLIDRLEPSSCGSAMPTSLLSATERACLQSWADTIGETP